MLCFKKLKNQREPFNPYFEGVFQEAKEPDIPLTLLERYERQILTGLLLALLIVGTMAPSII